VERSSFGALSHSRAPLPAIAASPIPTVPTGMRCAAAATDADILELTEENVEKVLDEVRDGRRRRSRAAPPPLVTSSPPSST